MNPIVEKLSDRPKEWLQKGNELVNPIIQKFNDRRKDWFNRGTEMWNDLQEKHAPFFERGQAMLDKGHAALDRGHAAIEDALQSGYKTFGDFEPTVLNHITTILDWAYTATGEKSEAIRKSREFIAERLEELKKSATAEAEEATEAPETPAEAAEPKAEPQTVDNPMPFEGYSDLTAKEIAEKLEGMSKEELQAVVTFETSTKGRKTVLEAAERLLAQ